MVDLFPVSWDANDVDDQYIITLYGKTQEGDLVGAHIEFFPYFFVQVPGAWGAAQVRLFVMEAAKDLGAAPQFCQLVHRVSLWGFTNGTKLPLVQLAFPTLRQMKWAAKTLKKTHQVFESSIDPLLRFFHVRDILPAAWVHIGKYAEVKGDRKTTRAPLELRSPFSATGPSTLEARPPLVFASFDLECTSRKRRFPQAANPDDHIIQVSTTFSRYGEVEPYKTSVLCFRETADVPGIDIQWFHEEHQMLNAWFDLLAAENVDVLLSYNGLQ
jgi:DNA polymerase delta subunit 1